jgi:hypothetical protein
MSDACFRVGRRAGILIAHWTRPKVWSPIRVVLAWQVVFIIIGRDPAKFRPLMLPPILEKLGYGLAVVLLVMQVQSSRQQPRHAGRGDPGEVAAGFRAATRQASVAAIRFARVSIGPALIAV